MNEALFLAFTVGFMDLINVSFLKLFDFSFIVQF